MNKGILVVVSGFSGAGKGTVMKAFLEKYDNYALSISATTRAPREGEMDGREYFFKTVEEFENLIANDDLIEYVKYVKNYYGTPKAYVLEQLELGKDVILEIEVQGALKVKEKMPDTPLIFMTPPSAEELRRRLIERGTESMEEIEDRLRTANEEAKVMDQYDYILINDKIEECVDNLHELIQNEKIQNGKILNEKHSVSRNEKFISTIREELKVFLKGDK